MDTLRFTTSAPQGFGFTDEKTIRFNAEQFCTKHKTELSVSRSPKHETAYIHGDAEDLAKYDIPIFFSGELRMLDKPVKEQRIIMHLEDKEYQMTATVNNGIFKKQYYLELKSQ